MQDRQMKQLAEALREYKKADNEFRLAVMKMNDNYLRVGDAMVKLLKSLTVSIK